MKSIYFFVLFFLNAVIGILFRLDVACTFASIAFLIGVIMMLEPENTKGNDTASKSE